MTSFRKVGCGRGKWAGDNSVASINETEQNMNHQRHGIRT